MPFLTSVNICHWARSRAVDGMHLNESSRVDTQLIQEIKQGKEGVSIKLADRQKAIDWLSKYFLMYPDTSIKRSLTGGARRTGNLSNGFINALEAQAESVMEEVDEIIETEDSIQV